MRWVGKEEDRSALAQVITMATTWINEGTKALLIGSSE